ncbi:MAG: element excision factor XisH family protein [Nostoc sp.]|uniref:element excision factor XisH family protein n=1 Tax=Nostoc sp. TaxID=1180 RepID=UPI002FF4E3EB
MFTQFVFFASFYLIVELEPERMLYLAVPNRVFDDLFEELIGKLLQRNHRLKLITFDPKQEVIKQWIIPN